MKLRNYNELFKKYSDIDIKIKDRGLSLLNIFIIKYLVFYV